LRVEPVKPNDPRHSDLMTPWPAQCKCVTVNVGIRLWCVQCH